MGWPCMLARFSTPNATVAIPSTAYAARRCRGVRHRHAGAGSGPASTWISSRHARRATAWGPVAAGAVPGVRLTISG